MIYLNYEEAHKRPEVFYALALGFIVSVFWVFNYQNPLVIVFSIGSALAGLFTLIQVARKSINNAAILYPSLATTTIVMIAFLEGEGASTNTWLNFLGIFLFLNIYVKAGDERLVFRAGFILLLLFLVIGFVEANGILPNQTTEVSFGYVIQSIATFIIMMVALALIFRQYRTMLQIVAEESEEQVSQQELVDQNHGLKSNLNHNLDEINVLQGQLLSKVAKIQATSDISQDLMGSLHEGLGNFLNLATRIISEKLGYYHVGIFLVDDANEFAVLRGTNSKGGQQMLARRHKLKIGSTGLVGYVAQSGRPRIALDAGVDAVFFNNPYLPETRSEISLPLKISNKVIGVLDVQSTQPSAFTEEDISILTTIANQIAVILQADEESSVFDSSKRGAKSAYAYRSKRLGYSFNPDGSIVSNNSSKLDPALTKVVISGEVVVLPQSVMGKPSVLAVPVKYREQVIGIIQVEAEGNRRWTETEVSLVQAISDRAALALENARLFEDATRRAEQEESISRITSQISASTDFDRIMQTTIQELGLALGATRSYIQLGSPDAQEDKALE